MTPCPPYGKVMPRLPTGSPTMKYSEPYRSAVKIQRLVTAQALEAETKARELCLLARAFCELEETKRKLRMKPLPKPVDVTTLVKATGDKAQGSGISE